MGNNILLTGSSSETTNLNFQILSIRTSYKKMAPTGIVSSNEISSTTGLYAVSNKQIPKISSNYLSSNMVSSTTGTTYSTKISNTKVLGPGIQQLKFRQIKF